MLLNTATYFLEQALRSEDGKKALGNGLPKLHCREQLLVARLMAHEWKSKMVTEWQAIIDKANNDHPQYSPLVHAKRAMGYKPATNGHVGHDGHDLAVVSIKGKLLISAEDQLIGFAKTDKTKEGNTQVHAVVKIAYEMFCHANGAHAAPSVVAVPIAVGTSSGAAEAFIAQLLQEKEELEKQLKDAKDANLDDFREMMSSGRQVTGMFSKGAAFGEVGLAAMKSKPDDTDKPMSKVIQMETLKKDVESLQIKNATLEELSRKAAEATDKLIVKIKDELAETKEALDDKKTEMKDALAYKSEELNDSQEIIDEQKDEIDTLKDLIHKYQVDLHGMEVMIMFADEGEDVNVDELWERTMAYIAAKHRSLDEAVMAAVKKYGLPDK